MEHIPFIAFARDQKTTKVYNILIGSVGCMVVSLTDPECPGSLYKVFMVDTSHTYTFRSAEPADTYSGESVGINEVRRIVEEKNPSEN